MSAPLCRMIAMDGLHRTGLSFPLRNTMHALKRHVRPAPPRDGRQHPRCWNKTTAEKTTRSVRI